MYDTEQDIAAPDPGIPAPLVRFMDAQEAIQAAGEHLRDAPMFGGWPPPKFPAKYLTRHGRRERRRTRRRLFALRDAVDVLHCARVLAAKISPRAAGYPDPDRLSWTRHDRIDQLESLEDVVAQLVDVQIPAFDATPAPPPRSKPAGREAQSLSSPTQDDTPPTPEGQPA